MSSTNTGDVLVVVQARTGSTRLPGKVLKDIGGVPMLELQLRRLLPVTERPEVKIVVATSDLPGDDLIAEVAASLGLAVTRGSEHDVLGRFAQALQEHPADIVVRITADCPLSDPNIVGAAIDLHRGEGVDYTSNVLPRTYPKGLDVEVVSAAALLAADREATARPDREHVTPFVYRHPERFRLANLDSGFDLGEEWWTVDRPEDLTHIRAIVAQLESPVNDGWQVILDKVGTAVTVSPGELSFHPEVSAAPGSSPWVRSWKVRRSGSDEGRVVVETQAGNSTRETRVPGHLIDEVTSAFDHFIAGDQQSRS